LLFPHGTPGYDRNLEKNNPTAKYKRVSVSAYWCFHMHERGAGGSDDSQYGATHDDRTRLRRFSALHRGGKLLGEKLLDAYLLTESDRLAYQAKNQKQLRAETYAGVQAAVLATTGATVGRKVILAPSFVGGPRHYHEQYRNAMAIVRAFGKPDLFITFTCNPKWPEITRELLPGQTAVDRPDLVARVFKMKLDALLTDLWETGIFGHVRARLHTVRVPLDYL
jgi:hypothetical protein